MKKMKYWVLTEQRIDQSVRRVLKLRKQIGRW